MDALIDAVLTHRSDAFDAVGGDPAGGSTGRGLRTGGTGRMNSDERTTSRHDAATTWVTETRRVSCIADIARVFAAHHGDWAIHSRCSIFYLAINDPADDLDHDTPRPTPVIERWSSPLHGSHAGLLEAN